MIRDNRASLSVFSDTKTVGEISALVGMQPDRWGERGDLTPAGRAGRSYSPERLTYERTFWSLTETVYDPGADDQTGFSALRALVRKLEPRAEALAELRHDGETVLRWSGDSDSTQGGFVLEADLIRGLATLGCSLYGIAYLEEDEAVLHLDI
ncbi:MAG: hypothetical protein K0S37_3884 [Microbacterium sp.]|jgi:hypothetical protein|nr:hypothetical protein [Microbacterium sp.]